MVMVAITMGSLTMFSTASAAALPHLRAIQAAPFDHCAEMRRAEPAQSQDESPTAKLGCLAMCSVIPACRIDMLGDQAATPCRQPIFADTRMMGLGPEAKTPPPRVS